ncbi:hypothetical protein GALL_530060 [mine drainage metagenome]|uniref:Uncharacterized protein n=1 Tax=mine drainage metagenome TaxID=410659 RepID=A0A1J5PJI1_9ZZZZ
MRRSRVPGGNRLVLDVLLVVIDALLLVNLLLRDASSLRPGRIARGLRLRVVVAGDLVRGVARILGAQPGKTGLCCGDGGVLVLLRRCTQGVLLRVGSRRVARVRADRSCGLSLLHAGLRGRLRERLLSVRRSCGLALLHAGHGLNLLQRALGTVQRGGGGGGIQRRAQHRSGGDVGGVSAVGDVLLDGVGRHPACSTPRITARRGVLRVLVSGLVRGEAGHGQSVHRRLRRSARDQVFAGVIRHRRLALRNASALRDAGRRLRGPRRRGRLRGSAVGLRNGGSGGHFVVV